MKKLGKPRFDLQPKQCLTAILSNTKSPVKRQVTPYRRVFVEKRPSNACIFAKKAQFFFLQNFNNF